MEAKILTPLQIEHIPGSMFWRTTAWFCFQSAILGRRIYIPPKFVTDFHSVPRFFWHILPPHENPESGVVHDWLYLHNGCTRKQADQVHKEVLEVLNCSYPESACWWKRQTMYVGIRLGGWVPWNRYRKLKRCK
jgi:hypothetical protein